MPLDARWAEYARIQGLLMARPLGDEAETGLEAVLDALLSSATGFGADAVARAGDSARRGVRRRRALVRRERARADDDFRVHCALGWWRDIETYLELSRVFDRATPNERAAIAEVMSGRPACGAAASRKRLERLRTRLAA